MVRVGHRAASVQVQIHRHRAAAAGVSVAFRDASTPIPDRLNYKTTTQAPLQRSPVMAHIFFAASIQRHIPTPEREVDARTLGEALEAIFADRPQLRGYILDDQGALRRHLAVFVDGRRVLDRQHLSDALCEKSQVHVIQALSGG